MDTKAGQGYCVGYFEEAPQQSRGFGVSVDAISTQYLCVKMQYLLDI